MDFKIDENLPVELAKVLRRAGHDALTVRDQLLQGQADSRVLAVCRQEHRVLVTCDQDFANTRAYPPEENAGIIVLRLMSQDKPHILQTFEGMLPLLRQRPLHGHLWIVEETRIRIRPSPENE